MTKHTVKSYDKDIKAIKDAIVSMGQQVAEMLLGVITMLETGSASESYYLDTQAMDQKVNNLDFQIEKQAITTLALRQPMAIDLRILISALKIAVILERMGDLMKNTTRRLSLVKNTPDSTLYMEIKVMAQIAYDMLEATISAFKALDKNKALKVCKTDLKVDEIYVKLLRRVEALMKKYPDDINELLHIIFAVRNIERFADYISKCAKIIYYIDSGEVAPREIIKSDVKYDKTAAGI